MAFNFKYWHNLYGNMYKNDFGLIFMWHTIFLYGHIHLCILKYHLHWFSIYWCLYNNLTQNKHYKLHSHCVSDWFVSFKGQIHILASKSSPCKLIISFFIVVCIYQDNKVIQVKFYNYDICWCPIYRCLWTSKLT